MSVIGVMTDRNGQAERKSVRHRDHDGQKWMGREKNVRHQGYDGQKWTDREEKCPS